MRIHQELANDIVQEMKKIIGKDINYIATDGIILASTDAKRVGSFHEAASIVAKEKRSLVLEKEGEYEGSYPGINLPVYLKQKIVGIIGISGAREEVENYGRVIQKMTEILIRDSYSQEREAMELEEESLFLEGVLLEEGERRRALVMKQTDFLLPERGQVLSLRFEDALASHYVRRQKLLNAIRNLVKQRRGYVMRHHGVMSILLFHAVEDFLEDLKALDLKSNEYRLGVGEEGEDFKKSYQESLLALDWAIRRGVASCYHENMDLGLLLASLPKKAKKVYLKKLFQNLEEEEIEAFRPIFEAYENYDGSLKKISEALFLHRNTLQYQVKRFQEKTGLDLRKYHDFCLLKLAYTLRTMS